ncbi:unnamed protein product [Rotaria sordida]|uniref:Uncharacterized protein n=1 Tax=Rotaria sordida TaxID=392033 RepID=A0A818VQQ6_9BILA|nr:unnamed protein product [Rotaria sordida]
MLGINNQVVSFVSPPPPTTTIEATDLEDGHPNHQLWNKMTDNIGRHSFSSRDLSSSSSTYIFFFYIRITVCFFFRSLFL